MEAVVFSLVTGELVCGGNVSWPRSDPTKRCTMQVWATQLPRCLKSALIVAVPHPDPIYIYRHCLETMTKWKLLSVQKTWKTRKEQKRAGRGLSTTLQMSSHMSTASRDDVSAENYDNIKTTEMRNKNQHTATEQSQHWCNSDAPHRERVLTDN